MKEETPLTNHPHLIPTSLFIKTTLKNLCLAFAILLVSLLAGMWGYWHFEQMSIVDAYVNAAMILSGMGPMNTTLSQHGKIFAGTYALFSGVIFLAAIALVLTPVFHRIIQRLHLKSK